MLQGARVAKTLEIAHSLAMQTFCIHPYGNGDKQAEEALEAMGHHVIRFTETVWVDNPVFGRARPEKGGNRQKVQKERRLFPGYIFCEMLAPRWHVILAHRHIRAVLNPGGIPRVITWAEIMAIRKLPAELEERRKAEQEAKRLRPGDLVHVSSGRWEGHELPVLDVCEERGRALLSLLGVGRIEVEIVALEKMPGMAAR
jgi:transcription antitermination factor NusG